MPLARKTRHELTGVYFLVHGKPAEVNATAFDVLFGVHFESVMLEKWTSGQTGVSKDS